MIRLVAATLAILALAALLGSTIAVFAFGLLLFVAGVRLLDADVSIWDGYVPGY